MNGQTLVKGFVPLPAGSQGVYTAPGLTYYRHGDWLGSSRFSSTPVRGCYYDLAYAPFGEDFGHTTQFPCAKDPVDLNFTGQNQDTVSGLYDFLYREYAPTQGRWISPDPAGVAAVDITNPQSWNRYAYVANNPLNAIDPDGQDPCIYGIDPNTGNMCAIGVADPGYIELANRGHLDTTNTGVTAADGPLKGGGSLGGGTHLPPDREDGDCVKPNAAQRSVAKGLAFLAKALNKTIGVGFGGSYGLGFGQGFGFAGTASAQLQVTPGGKASLVYTWGGSGITQPLLTPSSLGASFVVGPQVSNSTAPPSPGPGADFAISAVLSKQGIGPAVGRDLNVTADGATGTLTGGLGGGLVSGSAVVTKTSVVPLCTGG